MRSLVNKLLKFQSFIYSSLPDIIGVTETWLNDSIMNNEILSYDYSIYRKDRSSRGGGVLLAIHNSIPTKLIASPSKLEVIAVELINIKCTVCTVYLPPNVDLYTFTDTLSFLNQLARGRNILIIGDFNRPDINWSLLSGSSVMSTLFCDFVFDCNLTQLVSKPTHNKGNCIDLVVTSSPEAVGSINVSSNSLLCSDHYLVSFLLSANKRSSSPAAKCRYVLDHSKLDYERLVDYLLNYDYSTCLNCTDVETVWSILQSIINNGINQFAPLVKLRANKNHPKWYNSTTRHLINRVRSSRKKAKFNPSVTNISKLEKEEQDLCDQMEIAKSTYEAQLVDEFAYNNNNKLYKYIKSIQNNNSLPIAMHLNSHTGISDQDKASLFNQFFESVYSKSTSRAPHTHSQLAPTPVMDHIVITDSEVYTALSSLDPLKASGIDGIGPKILQTCSLALYPVVHHLFSLSLVSCKLPTEWKLHRIIPIFKSGDKSLITNYRPISLLCSISKVLERIVFDRVSGGLRLFYF